MKRAVAAALMFGVLVGTGSSAAAQGQGSVSGAVVDPLGARIARATVTLLRDGQPVAETTSGDQGVYAFQALAPGRYQIRALADGFEPRTIDDFFVGGSGRIAIDVALAIGPLRQDVLVTAAAIEVPTSQIGAQVTVIDTETLDNLAKVDVFEAMRLVPGAQVLQAGQRGSPTSFFVRGGNADFNKVLVDGVPVNDIGGGFDFSQLSVTGVDRVEVLREANSVLYGTDSMTGVVSLTTRRGRTRIPELGFSIDGGNFGTVRKAVSIGGVVQRLDYFSEYTHFATDNEVQHNAFRNGTVAGRVSVRTASSIDVSGTFRRIRARSDSPNGFSLYQIPDDSRYNNTFSYASVAAQSQITGRLQTTIRIAGMEQDTASINPTPTGQPFDGCAPFGCTNFLGNTVTLTAANGQSVTGQAILDFGGTYPSVFTSHTRRRLIFGQVSYRILPGLDVTGGARLEKEEGSTLFNAGPRNASERKNGGAFVEARATVRRIFVSAGAGFEHNRVFENAVSPRVSVAAYVRSPSSASPVGETKVIFNAGKGIKAPGISQELSSVYELVTPGQAAALGVGPIGPERARTLDVGVEQGLWRSRMRVRATFFHNDFSNLIQFVSNTVLPQLGVSPAAAAATGFGAYFNADSYRARGIETSVDATIGPRVRAAASYTYLDAEVTESFGSGALAPATNPAFPGINIGAFSPLVGNRPFRRPAHSGNLLLSYIQGPAQVSVAGYFQGAQDDSTFLSDGFFGNSLLLPNQDLDPGYSKFDLSASYRIHPMLKWYVSIENVLDKQYEAAFGYPALGRAARTGVTATFGGDTRR